MDKTVTVIQNLSNSWHYKINLGQLYNTPFSINFTDNECELFTCIEHGLKGTGSASHGYDHDNKDETKSLSLVQPKKCKSCNSKVHFFKDKCDCGSEIFDYINDSRWGIDCAAHFKYDVQNYHLWILEPVIYDYTCREFSFKQFIIDSKNKIFNEILHIQLTKGAIHSKNFLPNSSDFYASNPVEVCRFRIKIDDVFGVMVSRENPEKIVYDQSVIKKMSKVLGSAFLNNKDVYLYEELTPYINILDKKTTHGKNRGETSRREK